MAIGSAHHAAAEFVARAKSIKTWKSLRIVVLSTVISVSFNIAIKMYKVVCEERFLLWAVCSFQLQVGQSNMNWIMFTCFLRMTFIASFPFNNHLLYPNLCVTVAHCPISDDFKKVKIVEEANKKIYACSTTTYNGFQVEVSEEMSEKFKGLPGVVFVLPDSYIDPVNKEYGADKYINGTIIPRPPPISFARLSGRYGNRNRDFNRPRCSYQQGNSTFDNQGSMQGNARNFGPPQNPPPQQN